MKSLEPSEYEIQKAYFSYVRAKACLDPLYKNIASSAYGIFLGGRTEEEKKRAFIEIAKQKASGMSVGFPDVTIAVARNFNGKPIPGMYIETKKKGKKPSKEQFDWHRRLKLQGYLVLVCDSVEQMINATDRYLSLPPLSRSLPSDTAQENSPSVPK